MAFFLTARFFIKQLIKSEVIMNKVSQRSSPIINTSDKYINELKSMNIKSEDLDASEFLKFPLKTFYKFPKIAMENIITTSFEILLEKGLVTINLYEHLIDAYLKYGIELNANDIKESMIKNGVSINKTMCSYFIRHFSLIGQMESTEQVMNEMQSKKIQLTDTDKFLIVTGYFIVGDSQKAEIFIAKNNLKSHKMRLSFAKCFAFATNNDWANLLDILKQNKQDNIKFYPTDYFRLYRRSVESNISQSALNEVINFTKDDVSYSPADLFGTVTRLNSADYFHQAIFIIFKFLPMVDDNVPLIESFTYSRCPLDIFKKALKVLLKCDGKVRTDTNIFSKIDIDSALEISLEFAKDDWKIIYFSIINRAVEEKSPEVLQKVLEFCVKNAGWRNLNDVLFLVFFESLERNEMITNCEEVFDLIPRFKQVMLRVILMRYLCSGEFGRYNELLLKEKFDDKINIPFSWKLLSKHIRTCMNLEHIKQFSHEAHKGFTSNVINGIIVTVFCDEIIRIANSGMLSELNQANRWLKEWNLQLEPENISVILQSIPQQHREIVESSITKGNNAANKGRIQRT